LSSPEGQPPEGPRADDGGGIEDHEDDNRIDQKRDDEPEVVPKISDDREPFLSSFQGPAEIMLSRGRLVGGLFSLNQQKGTFPLVFVGLLVLIHQKRGHTIRSSFFFNRFFQTFSTGLAAEILPLGPLPEVRDEIFFATFGLI
jgi:hypothetical protein